MERKQEKFCLEYTRTGNATTAYKLAGYRTHSDAVAASSGWRLLRNAKVQQRLTELRGELAADAVACALERAEFLTFVMRDNETKTSDRLKAADLLNKMTGQYVQRLAGADGGPLAYSLSWKSDGDNEDDEAEDDE